MDYHLELARWYQTPELLRKAAAEYEEALTGPQRGQGSLEKQLVWAGGGLVHF